MELPDRAHARAFQAMVAMRDGTRLNTFVFLPQIGGPRWPVILHRTPYGITVSDARDMTDCANAWLPSGEEPFRGSILRGWRNIVAHGYAAVYQDTRGRHGSEGEDRVYAATTLSNGSLPSPGPIRWWACPAPRPAPPPPSLPRQRGTRAFAPFLPKLALPASTTTWFMRASRSRWSGCGYGWRATSQVSRHRTVRRSCDAPASAQRRSMRPLPRRRRAIRGLMPRATPTHPSLAQRIGCGCR